MFFYLSKHTKEFIINKIFWYRIFSLLIIISFGTLLTNCQTSPDGSIPTNQLIAGGAVAGGVGIFFIVRAVKKNKAEKEEQNRIQKLQEENQRKTMEEQEERQKKIAEEQTVLEKAPILISLTELVSKYQQKSSGNYIVNVELDYNNDIFIQDQEKFTIPLLQFVDVSVRNRYALRKPDGIYKVFIILKGIDVFHIYLADISGEIFSDSEKLSYDNRLKEEEQARIKAESERIRIEAERAEQVRREQLRAEQNEVAELLRHDDNKFWGYDSVAWGSLVEDVRKAYNLTAIYIEERDGKNPNITNITQNSPSDSMQRRIFHFYYGLLFKVEVRYKSSSDSTFNTIQNLLIERYGRVTSSRTEIVNLGQGATWPIRHTVFSSFSPDIEVRIEHVNYDIWINRLDVIYVSKRIEDSLNKLQFQL